MIQIHWENEQTEVVLPEPLLECLQALTSALATHEQLQPGEVSVLFVNDETIRELNAEFRGMDKATDVLSFAIQEEQDDELPIVYAVDNRDEEPPNLYGDIVISAERAFAQANDYGHSFLREICFLYVHGFLHLLGYDHLNEEDERAMVTVQDFILAKVGIER